MSVQPHNDVGPAMRALAAELYPICRSITGEGLRETLRMIQAQLPGMELHEVPTGTKVFDWTVPREWNIRDAWIKDAAGRRVVSFGDCNLHVVNYSTPIRGKMTLAELRPHLFSLPKQPELIPYRYSHWEETWGFCLEHRVLKSLVDGEYEACIDSTLTDGSLTYGEYFISGETNDEVLISSHCCHPSLANDNLSGIALAVQLARTLRERRPRYSYRFLFAPGTIGAITWLCVNEATAARIKHGLVFTCVGDSGHPTYKKTRRGDAEIDRAMVQVLKDSGQPHDVVDFSPYGYDERQYNSPGFNLPVGCLMRTPHGQFPEYHTSGDNLDFIKPESLADSYDKALAAIIVLEVNRSFINLNPKCEPQLGRHGVFTAIRAHPYPAQFQMAVLWVLNLSDGTHDLAAIAARSGLRFSLIADAAKLLVERGLLARP